MSITAPSRADPVVVFPLGRWCPPEETSQPHPPQGWEGHIQDGNSGINALKPRENGPHFADDIFKCIFVNENLWIPLKISLKFVPKGPINNIPSLVQIMAWRRTGDKPLSEPMMVRLPTYICVTWPQWVNCWYIHARKFYTYYWHIHDGMFYTMFPLWICQPFNEVLFR